MAKLRAVLVVGILLSAACGGSDDPGGAKDGEQGTGSGVERITPPDTEMWGADVSADGGTVVFVAGLNGSGEIMTGDLTGEASEPFLQTEAYASEPELLPDGRVAFVFHVDGDAALSELRLAVAEADGSSFEVLKNAGEPFDLAVSADGQFIYYVTNDFPEEGDPWTLRRVGVDGEGDVELASEAGGRQPATPAVSYDGGSVAFVWTDDNYEEPDSIVVIDADGSNEVEVGEGSEPTWAPDEDRLAFIGDGGAASDGLPLSQIFVVTSEGGEPAPAGPAIDNIRGPLNWLPDDRILWLSGRATDEYGGLFAVTAP